MAKPNRFGKKQKRGSSRATYFANRKSYLAARNKERRIAKDARDKKRATMRKARRSPIKVAA
jgi:hypothetical protein